MSEQHGQKGGDAAEHTFDVLYRRGRHQCYGDRGSFPYNGGQDRPRYQVCTDVWITGRTCESLWIRERAARRRRLEIGGQCRLLRGRGLGLEVDLAGWDFDAAIAEVDCSP